MCFNSACSPGPFLHPWISCVFFSSSSCPPENPVCSKCIFSVIASSDFFFIIIIRKNNKHLTPQFTLSAVMFTSTYLRAEGSLASCGYPVPGLLCPAVASPVRKEANPAPGLWACAASAHFGAVWKPGAVPVPRLRRDHLSRAQGCLGVLLPSHHSCLARPCAGSGLYGQVRHPKTGRQLQVGKSPPAISLLFVPLLKTVLKDLLGGLEDTSVTPIQRNCSPSSPSLSGDRWQILLVNLKNEPSKLLEFRPWYFLAAWVAMGDMLVTR